MSCPHTTSLLPLLFAAAVLAQEPRLTLTPDVYPAGGITWHGDEQWITLRAVDAIRDTPLPLAEVLLIAESPHPMRGEFWRQMRAMADADGFVRLRADHRAEGYVKWHWVLVRAPGHGPRMFMTPDHDGLLRLAPALDLPLRVLDRLGHPAADALVGMCGGCGHSPDLAHARTDAEGVAVLRGVDRFGGFGDIYIEHPGLHLGYADADWFPGERPFDFFVRPGVDSIGVVVDAAGQPVRDAFVGTKDVHRGPWTRTDAHGAFALYGSEDASDLFVHFGEREILFDRPTTTPMRLQLPAHNGATTEQVNGPPRPEPREIPAEQAAMANFQVRSATGHAVANARVRCIGPLPNRDETVSHLDADSTALLLAHGRYEVFATGDDHVALREVLEVTATGANDFTLRPARMPSAVVRIADLPEWVHVDLVTEAAARNITALVHQGAPIGLPEAPFHIVLHSARSRRVFTPDRQAALAAGVLRLRWFAPTRIEGQLVDAHGAPIAAKVALLPIGSFDAAAFAKVEGTPTTGALAIDSEDVGLRLLTVLADDQRQPRVVPIVLPPRGADVVVDVGTLALGGAPRLLLLDSDGEALVDGKVGLLRPGWSDLNAGGLAFPVDAGGEWFGPDPRVGDAILVAGNDDEGEPDAIRTRTLDVRFPIDGQGPWTLRLPGGEIDVDVRDEQGEPLTANVFVGSECVELEQPTRLRRLWPGLQRLFVAAEGHQSAIVDVTVPATGRAAVKVVLPKR